MLPGSWKEKKQIFQMRENASRKLEEKEANLKNEGKCFLKLKRKRSKNRINQRNALKSVK